jgi:hypothetical protein
MNDTPPLAVALLIAVAMVPPGLIVWTILRARRHIRAWAADQELRLQRVGLRLIRRGPYWANRTKAQHVFHVVALDRNDRRRTGFVRVGGAFKGVMSNEVHVTWDEPS